MVCAPAWLHAQEEEKSIAAATGYLDSRTASINKYLERSQRIQQKLLKRLKLSEDRFARRLARQDSSAHRDYLEKTLTSDSIAKLSQDTSQINKLVLTKNAVIDSLKNIQKFVTDQTAKLNALSVVVGNSGVANPYTDKLNNLQQRLNVQEQVKQQLQQRTKILEGLAVNKSIPGLQRIQKDVYYTQEKIKAWKQLADEPDDVEEKTLEYLQGTEGFNEYLNSNANSYNGLGNNPTAADLQRSGFQTKQQVAGMLQQKLGDNLGAVQQQMAAQVQQHTEKLGGGITGKVKDAKEGLKKVKQTLAEAKAAKEQLQNIEKPAFKKNPERGKPFWQRLETQYNFQTARPTVDGLRPAMLELGASLAFKHTPKLSYGLGIGLSTGLGQNWQNIKLSYEGISARAYADWIWQYGIHAQAGYERIFRPGNRAYLPGQPDTEPGIVTNNENTLRQVFGGQQQAAYIGLMKRYRINSKWNGTFLVGYNFLAQQEGLRTPFMLRLGWGK